MMEEYEVSFTATVKAENKEVAEERGWKKLHEMCVIEADVRKRGCGLEIHIGFIKEIKEKEKICEITIKDKDGNARHIFTKTTSYLGGVANLIHEGDQVFYHVNGEGNIDGIFKHWVNEIEVTEMKKRPPSKEIRAIMKGEEGDEEK